MNLIDRDELMEERKLAIKVYENANILNAKAIREYLKPLLDKIIDLPTIEKPQGKWKIWGKNYEGKYSFYCTNCLYKTKYGGDTTKHCPECGAEMK